MNPLPYCVGMKTGIIIFWSLLFAFIGTSASFAGVDAPTIELGHYAQRGTHAPMQVSATDRAILKSCDPQADCTENIEHSCQTCASLMVDFARGESAINRFVETRYTGLAALGFGRDIVIPPRI